MSELFQDIRSYYPTIILYDAISFYLDKYVRKSVKDVNISSDELYITFIKLYPSISIDIDKTTFINCLTAIIESFPIAKNNILSGVKDTFLKDIFGENIMEIFEDVSPLIYYNSIKFEYEKERINAIEKILPTDGSQVEALDLISYWFDTWLKWEKWKFF